MYQSNPYNVLSEVISLENVQRMGELITLKALKTRCAYANQALDWLYRGLVRDLNRFNVSIHTFSDGYDLVQNAICFLFDFIGKSLDDVYTVKNGQVITIKRAVYKLISRQIDRIRRYAIRFCDLDSPIAQSVYVEIDHYEEKDYTEVDNKIERLGLKPRDRAVLDCYMAGMTCNEIAEFLDISRITVWRRRTRAQVKYKALFF